MSRRYAKARRAYQSTSADAFESMQSYLGPVDDNIMEQISYRHGLTCQEVEMICCLSHQTVSAQIRHLVQGGLLEDSGTKRPTSSGRQAIVWRLAPKSDQDAGRLPLEA